jgi:Ca2+-binding EF-hand superfamily protein
MRALLGCLLLLLLLDAQAAREPLASRLYGQWRQADRDGDGELSRTEAAAMPALASRFDTIDRDGNGRLSPEEVRTWRASRRGTRRAPAPGGVSAVFARADANADGTLSRAEVEKALPRMARNFERIDADHDGRIERTELDAWIARRRVR